ncbi:MAG: hypothetical protein AAGA60_16310 [Cyanobacteria bacterium P01_E01_bin.42]
MNDPYWLDRRDIVAIHNEILTESGGRSGILNESALDSTLHKPPNPTASKYPNPSDRHETR